MQWPINSTFLSLTAGLETTRIELVLTAASRFPHWEQKVKNSLWQQTQSVNKASFCFACLRICLIFLFFFKNTT